MLLVRQLDHAYWLMFEEGGGQINLLLSVPYIFCTVAQLSSFKSIFGQHYSSPLALANSQLLLMLFIEQSLNLHLYAKLIMEMIKS